MPLAPADIVNRAVQLIGGFNNQQAVTGSPPNFDNTVLGVAAGVLYADVVQTVGRQFGYDFSRNLAILSATGNTPPPGWSYEYSYPANGIEVRQVRPATLADPNNPLPVDWVVGNTLVSAVPTKVIWTNVASAQAYFTNQPPESLWDPLFTETVVRLLASGLAMAAESKPETSQVQMTAATEFGALGQTRDG